MLAKGVSVLKPSKPESFLFIFCNTLNYERHYSRPTERCLQSVVRGIKCKPVYTRTLLLCSRAILFPDGAVDWTLHTLDSCFVRLDRMKSQGEDYFQHQSSSKQMLTCLYKKGGASPHRP